MAEPTTPSYRNDSPEGLAPELRAYLDEHFLQALPNLEAPNPKLVVVFSGGNAVGKSALSLRLGQELNGVVLENDSVKQQIMAFNPAVNHRELNLMTWQYTMDLYGRIAHEIPNGLIIRDGVIDWYFDRILPLFEQQGYKLFIVGYDVSNEEVLRLIHARGDKATIDTLRLEAQMDEHIMHQQRFRAVYTPDIILTDETMFNYDPVVAAVRQRLINMK